MENFYASWYVKIMQILRFSVLRAIFATILGFGLILVYSVVSAFKLAWEERTSFIRTIKDAYNWKDNG